MGWEGGQPPPAGSTQDGPAPAPGATPPPPRVPPPPPPPRATAAPTSPGIAGSAGPGPTPPPPIPPAIAASSSTLASGVAPTVAGPGTGGQSWALGRTSRSSWDRRSRNHLIAPVTRAAAAAARRPTRIERRRVPTSCHRSQPGQPGVVMGGAGLPSAARGHVGPRQDRRL